MFSEALRKEDPVSQVILAIFSNLNLHLKELLREGKIKSEVSKRKEITKIIVEIKEIKTKINMLTPKPNRTIFCFKILQWEFLLWLSRLSPQHCLCEDVGLIPGLAQWIKGLALP